MLSETTVSRYVRRFRERNPAPDVLTRGIAFLRNPKVAIAGRDFFAVPFVLIYVAVGFVMEALFGTRLRRHDNSDGTDSAGRGFDEPQPPPIF